MPSVPTMRFCSYCRQAGHTKANCPARRAVNARARRLGEPPLWAFGVLLLACAIALRVLYIADAPHRLVQAFWLLACSAVGWSLAEVLYRWWRRR